MFFPFTFLTRERAQVVCCPVVVFWLKPIGHGLKYCKMLKSQISSGSSRGSEAGEGVAWFYFTRRAKKAKLKRGMKKIL